MSEKFSIREKVFNFFYRFKYGTVMFLVGVIVVFWDLLSKLITDGKSAEVINGFISVQSSHNPGGAWSIMGEHPEVLIILSILFIVFLLLGNWFLQEKNYFYAISMGLVISGALGNLYDRIKYGKVRDFIKLEFMDFPIFNLADCAITVGVILLCVYFIFVAPYYVKKREKLELIKQEELKVQASDLEANEVQEDRLIKVENKEELESEQIIEDSNANSYEKYKETDEQYREHTDNSVEVIEEKSTKIKRSRRTKLGSKRKNNFEKNEISSKLNLKNDSNNNKNKRKIKLENKIEFVSEPSEVETVKSKNVQKSSGEATKKVTKNKTVGNKEKSTKRETSKNSEEKSATKKTGAAKSKTVNAKNTQKEIVEVKSKTTKAKTSSLSKKSTAKKTTDVVEAKSKTTRAKKSSLSEDAVVESKPKTRKTSTNRKATSNDVALNNDGEVTVTKKTTKKEVKDE